MTADRRDIKAAFGGIVLHHEGDYPTVLLTRSEADLRRSLASVAYVYGWNVSEEVVIPGWGRIDIVLEAGATYLIELKIDLTKPAKIRKAFQQADGYGRWWTTNKGTAAQVYVVGKDLDEAAIDVVADAYPAIWSRSVSSMLYFLDHGTYNTDNAVRRERAAARGLAVAELGLIYAKANASLREQQILAGALT